MLLRLDDWLVDRAAQPAADRLAGAIAPDALGRALTAGGAIGAVCTDAARFAAGRIGGEGLALTGAWVMGVWTVLRVAPRPVAGAAAVPARPAMRVWRLFHLPAAAATAALLAWGVAAGRADGFAVCVALRWAAVAAGAYFMACRAVMEGRAVSAAVRGG